jgi:hypothetical protein
MTPRAEQIAVLLHEAGEIHHRVYRIVDGDDSDWASATIVAAGGRLQLVGPIYRSPKVESSWIPIV